ncbi:MAG TPA: RHS repeat-associated core domain-containing protein, partial [Polyangia bacterium]
MTPPQAAEERYVYDRADNLRDAPGLAVAIQSGNRLATANGHRFEYDGRDNVSGRFGPDGETHYRYDSRDQLVAVDGPGLAYRAKHDALGRRTTKTFNGQTWKCYWDEDRLAAELFPDGKLRIYVYAAATALVPLLFVDYDSVEADPKSGRRYHVFTDHLGCPELVLDDRAQPVWRAAIQPYGQARIETGEGFHQPLRWPGHYFDTETGLHENRFRSYSPELGRYLQSDPIGMAGGTNLYAYTKNPLRSVDLDGLATKCELDPEHCPLN